MAGQYLTGQRVARGRAAWFDLLDTIHRELACAEGETFMELDLVGSQTNHNHEEIIENIEMYQCVAIRSL
jgi:hypothetical protein